MATSLLELGIDVGNLDWVIQNCFRYSSIDPDDIRVLLNAGRSLAETIAARENDKYVLE